MLTQKYLNEPIDYGGTIMPRYQVRNDLLTTFMGKGASRSQAERCADRWFQGYELKQQLDSNA